MEPVSYKKALLLFANYSWKILVALSVGVTIVSIAFNFELLKKYWLLYITIVLLLTVFVSLLLLVNNLIKITKKEIEDKTDISIPDQLLNIVSNLPDEEAVILIEAIDRYFHLYGHHEARTKLGNLFNENRVIQIPLLIDNLGWAKYIQDQTTEAINNIQRGVSLAKKKQEYYWVAKGERHLAGIELHRRNIEGAQKHLTISKEYTQLIQNKTQKNELEGHLFLLEAKILLQKKDFSNAKTKAEAALQLFSEDKRRKLKVNVVLGNIYLEQKQWDEAYDMFKEGYENSNGIRSDERAKNAIGIAKIHLNPESGGYYKIDKAKEYLIEADKLKNSLKRHEKEELESLLNGLP